ncbi:AEC family transporter [Oceanibium sediminis]|uniref:AEC family transporter n=1 Tax=Oceanibium sediminis TaxID=2026339 RepID=UPI000DD4274E|nr:AEC family transporter [Oceanibium sediminis]
MELILQVLEIVAPVFLLVGLGYGWVRIGWHYDVQFVTRLASELAIPCLIFVSLLRTTVDPVVLRDTAAAAVLSYAVLLGVFFVVLRARGLPMRVFLAPMAFGNTGNLGLPLALFAFGAAGLDVAVVVFATMSALYFSIGVWVISGQGRPWVALREPMTWATILGLLFLWQDWGLPGFAVNSIDLIGQMGIPLMLMTLGVAISRLHPGGFRRAFALAALKLAVCVAVGVTLGLAFALPAPAFGVLVLQLSTPVAVTGYMLAEKYRADPEIVAGLVVVSSLMAVVALPVLLAVLI